LEGIYALDALEGLVAAGHALGDAAVADVVVQVVICVLSRYVQRDRLL
jgi:hypothetical protein